MNQLRDTIHLEGEGELPHRTYHGYPEQYRQPENTPSGGTTSGILRSVSADCAEPPGGQQKLS